jgi:lipopolysaccharide/colanic/teichoic acid biosynthesis glycosyltransferase
MVSNAENMKKDLLLKNDNDGPTFKMNKDPRITWIGKILRKFSIDELPQFFNVLKGDMNVVGPRPYPVSEVNKFEKLNYYRRHSMKPGITGLWQIKDRRKIVKFKDSINLDLEYIDNWSFRIDAYIILMTLPIIIKGTGK